MSSDIDRSIAAVLDECDRIVVTARAPFNAKDRKRNEVLAEVHDIESIELLWSHLQVDVNSGHLSWLSPPDFYLNFLLREQLGSVS